MSVPTLSHKSKRVAVIGAGIVGLCTADALLDKGFEVIVLERDSSISDGCSFGNGGLVVPSHFLPLASPGAIKTGLPMLLDQSSPFGIDRWTSLETLGFLLKFLGASTADRVAKAAPLLRDLNLASRSRYEELVEKLNVPVGYARRGLLMLCNTATGFDGEAHLAEDANRLGLKADVLDVAAVTALEPNLRMEVKGGVYFHDDAHLSPAVTMFALRDRFISRGGQFRTSVTVSGLNLRDGKIESVQVGDEKEAADEVVIAAGALSGQLARSVGVNLPLLSGKGYGFTVTNPPEMPVHPAILVEGRIAVTPMLDGLRFVGTLELGVPKHGDSPLAPAQSRRLAGMKRNIPAYYPAFRPTDLEAPTWSGDRPCTPDGLPYVGRTRRISNMIIATGHAMMGMSLGPITGQLVAEIVAGETPSIDLALLSPDRYA